MERRTGEFAGQRWTVAIFSSREDPAQLMESAQAIATADCGGASLAIDLLVNGNPSLAAEMRTRLTGNAWLTHTTQARLWSLPSADKANAWNHYLHRLAPPTDLAFFLDAYVKIDRGALLCMAEGLQSRPHALAATSVPSSGRTSQALRRLYLEEGGLHGNFYAITGATMRRLQTLGFRLPGGIYRNDSALGACFAFDMEPRRNVWNWDRVAVLPEARYEAPVANPLRPDDLRAAMQRRWRQARGHLETRALKAHLADRKRSPLEWPATARELVLQWADENRPEALKLAWEEPLAWLALQRLRREHAATSTADRAECLGDYSMVRRVGARRDSLETLGER